MLTKVEDEIMLFLHQQKGEIYGAQLHKEGPKIKMGSIYVMLDRLTDKGLIQSRVDGEKAQRLLRLYQMTPKGQRFYAAWLLAKAIYNESN